MKIKYLGHSCFLLTESTGTAVVCDPYGSGVGYSMPEVSADAVTVSHHHFDHDNVKAVSGNPIVLDREQGYKLPGVEISAVKSYHDDCCGAKRGENVIFKFSMDGLEVCHLGDLGEECSTELLESVLPVNVLLVPVGGNYTIDAAMAREYVDRIMPEIVIPMHYRTKGCTVDIDKEDEFLSLMEEEGIEIEEVGDEVELNLDDMDNEHTKLLLMTRAESD